MPTIMEDAGGGDATTTEILVNLKHNGKIRDRRTRGAMSIRQPSHAAVNETVASRPPQCTKQCVHLSQGNAI